MDKKQELKNLIKNSNLEENDKIKWEEIVRIFPEDTVEAFLEIFSSFPEEISWFNENYKKKEKAAILLKEDKEKGQAALDEIYKEEAEKIKTLMGK